MPNWWWPWFWPRRSRPAPRRISLLVPYREDQLSPDRTEIWAWLRTYWEWHLPDAEIVLGHDTETPFSKARAVNDAARRAQGDIYVLLDADTYFEAPIIRDCANRIRTARWYGDPLWFIPYRYVFRLTQETTARILASDPQDPLTISTPPPDEDVESTLGSQHGHRFGAMIQIFPREAFELVGGMDTRFEGWGGEDIAFVRLLDTLYGSHKTTDNQVLHLWHHKIGDTHEERMWEGQALPNANANLASRYNMATGDAERMRGLIGENLVERADQHRRRRTRARVLATTTLAMIAMAALLLGGVL